MRPVTQLCRCGTPGAPCRQSVLKCRQGVLQLNEILLNSNQPGRRLCNFLVAEKITLKNSDGLLHKTHEIIFVSAKTVQLLLVLSWQECSGTGEIPQFVTYVSNIVPTGRVQKFCQTAACEASALQALFTNVSIEKNSARSLTAVCANTVAYTFCSCSAFHLSRLYAEIVARNGLWLWMS